ncbi:MAG: DUF742 domain-containing protein [Streptosporangiaceae bacterium]
MSTPGSNDWLPADDRILPGPGRTDAAAGGSRAPRAPRARDGRQYPVPKPAGTALVRPYAVTGGRTKPRYQLQIEAMVAASHYEARDLSALSPECQAILGFCRDWRSVAEISAVLRMPLGVARVLIADMAVEGLVRIHQLDHARGRPDLNLLERVLSGLRKL